MKEEVGQKQVSITEFLDVGDKAKRQKTLPIEGPVQRRKKEAAIVSMEEIKATQRRVRRAIETHKALEPEPEPVVEDDGRVERRGQRRHRNLVHRLDGADARLNGLHSLLFYTIMEYSVPDDADTALMGAQVDRLNEALDAARAPIMALRDLLRRERGATRPAQTVTSIVPAVEDCEVVTLDKLNSGEDVPAS